MSDKQYIIPPPIRWEDFNEDEQDLLAGAILDWLRERRRGSTWPEREAACDKAYGQLLAWKADHTPMLGSELLYVTDPKGWTPAKLSRYARAGRIPYDRCENGSRMYLYTAALVADALDKQGIERPFGLVAAERHGMACKHPAQTRE